VREITKTELLGAPSDVLTAQTDDDDDETPHTGTDHG